MQIKKTGWGGRGGNIFCPYELPISKEVQH